MLWRLRRPQLSRLIIAREIIRPCTFMEIPCLLEFLLIYILITPFWLYVCIRLRSLNFWNLNWKCFVFNRGRYWINHQNTTEKRGIVKKETNRIKLRPHGRRNYPLILSCRRFALMFSSFQSLNWWLIFKNLQLNIFKFEKKKLNQKYVQLPLGVVHFCPKTSNHR